MPGLEKPGNIVVVYSDSAQHLGGAGVERQNIILTISTLNLLCIVQ